MSRRSVAGERSVSWMCAVADLREDLRCNHGIDAASAFFDLAWLLS